MLETCAGVDRLAGVVEAAPGMNAWGVFHAPDVDLAALERQVLALWNAAKGEPRLGSLIEIPTVYGGEGGPDLAGFALGLGVEAATVACWHSAVEYRVAAIGAMAGFPYLSGLDPRLHAPRLEIPHPATPAGTVIIGAAQAGVLPCTAPTGWRRLGHTGLSLFDPHQTPPCRLSPGDRVRFVPLAILP